MGGEEEGGGVGGGGERGWRKCIWGLLICCVVLGRRIGGF